MAAELWAEAAARNDAVGLRARASAAARRAVATLGRCEGARTEPLSRLSTPVALSRRQRETAALARGASNAEIAATLSISERTSRATSTPCSPNSVSPGAASLPRPRGPVTRARSDPPGCAGPRPR